MDMIESKITSLIDNHVSVHGPIKDKNDLIKEIVGVIISIRINDSAKYTRLECHNEKN